MAAPPVPPRPMSARPDYFQDEYPGQYQPHRESTAPVVPPLPPNFPRSDTLTPHWNDPMPAPRPQKIMSNVPDDMAESLEQSLQQPSGFSMPVPSFAGGFAMPPPPPSAQGPAYGFRQPTMASQRPLSVAYPGPGGFASPPQPPPPRPLPQRQPTLPLAQSFDAMSLNSPQVSSYAPRQSSLMSPATIRPLPCAGSPTQAPPPPPSSPPPNFDEPAPAPGGAPAIVTPMPTVSTLLAAESRITKPSHLIAWSKAVLALVDRTQPDADPTRPEPISDPVLARLANVAVQHVISFASIWQPGSTGVPAHVAEALYLRGTLEASGAFPEKIPRDQRGAFRDFEVAARQGYMPGWFKLGRDYESVKDITHAREVFDRGARAKETSCLYRLGMAHLLGQLGIPATPSMAIPLLREAADLSNVDVPQPSYVFGMLLLGEFTQVTLPPALLAQALPQATQANPHPRASEARRRIERAAFLGFGPALYKMGWAYEHAKMGCAYDPLLSVQYYSAGSQRGEAEADMALSKWFLCGSEGAFDKDEHLAVVFAEKAANRRLASGMFAMGYYNEVGVGVKADRGEAVKWYTKAAAEGNTEAAGRLAALAAPDAAPLSRAEHETLTDSRLVRKHTRAKDTATAAGRVAQAKGEEERKAMAGAAHAAATDPNSGLPSNANANHAGRRPGQMTLPPSGRVGTPPSGHIGSPPRVSTPLRQGGTSPQRYGGTSPQRPASGASSQRPGRGGGAVRPHQQRYTLTDEGFQNLATPPQQTPQTAPAPAPAQAPAPAPAPAPAQAPPSAPATPPPTGGKSHKKGPQTFAEMGFQPAPVEDKDCVIM